MSWRDYLNDAERDRLLEIEAAKREYQKIAARCRKRAQRAGK